ncbi:hypothetical protein Nepgr_019645 [Nepenthes gracilis]|uniref:Uncharacterized protein n=1 Tax=Nepenthes gracilis TaxID=150966 RepID=A0AAD3XV90_NEPGR|nr:hypothetical protein Nepgr_019645 [Nepenthes gracilis]
MRIDPILYDHLLPNHHNTTLAFLNKLSLPSLSFRISCLIIDVDGFVQTMAQLASITTPSAFQFITVRLSDKKAIPPLRDKIGWCISSNSSSVKDEISCRMLCLNGQEIVLSGSINDLRSSSHPVKSMLNLGNRHSCVGSAVNVLYRPKQMCLDWKML